MRAAENEIKASEIRIVLKRPKSTFAGVSDTRPIGFCFGFYFC
jgi:hypothetical protein